MKKNFPLSLGVAVVTAKMASTPGSFNKRCSRFLSMFYDNAPATEG